MFEILRCSLVVRSGLVVLSLGKRIDCRGGLGSCRRCV